MRNFGYTNSIEYMSLDDYFSPEEKQLFLKIPHKIETQGKINIIDFNVPENGKYPILRNIKMIDVKESLTDEELSKRQYSSLLYKTNNFDGEVGLFIQADHGSYALSLLKELFKHDKESAIPLLNDYFSESIHCKDIINITDIFVRQVQQMKEYLVQENIIVKNFHLDYAGLSSMFEKLDEDEGYEELLKLQKKYGEGDRFPAYNDLDYTPMILAGDYCMYDSSGARLYIVKESGDTKKIYMINRDRRELNVKINEWLSDFLYDHNQSYILLKDTLIDSDLIAEIKNGQLVKSSIEMQTMNLLQSFIVSELVEQGKITENIPDLSFKELLENYTRQNEFYGLEERSLLPLLNSLIIDKNKVSYTDFSLMPNTKEIKHEPISNHTIETLLGKDKEGKKLSYIYEKTDFSKLGQLPQDYKNQIQEYLSELLDRDLTENTQILVDTISSSLNQTTKKLKP